MSERRKFNRKRFVSYDEGAALYSMGITKFVDFARDAKACYKVGRRVLVNVDILEEYLETFRILDDDYYK